jgi:hypothetical protein
VEAAQHAGLPQRADALQRGRRRDADALGQLVVGDARVLAERLEDGAVDVVQAGILRHGRMVADGAERSSTPPARCRTIRASTSA